MKPRKTDVERTERAGAYADPTLCPECGLLFHDKKWSWEADASLILKGKRVAKRLCPACKSVAEHKPGGEVHLRGKYFVKHMWDIRNLVGNLVDREEIKNPLSRVIDATIFDGTMTIRTTTPQLSRAIASAVKRSHKGTLEGGAVGRYPRLVWQRD